MLKLIKCEFWKLKRKKFIQLVVAAAFLFPIAITYYSIKPSSMQRYDGLSDAFNGLFNNVLAFGMQFLLPCIIGILASILFFMERDSNTFKNLKTIPVTIEQMVFAKIMVLFIFSIIFCLASTLATTLCGMVVFKVNGMLYKLLMSVEMGIFITAGTLPLIVLVVYFSRTYIFSILLCIFYSILSMSATSLYDILPKSILWLIPMALTTFWSAGDMVAHGIKLNLSKLSWLIPSTFCIITILGIMAVISIYLMIVLYKKWEE
ncbi:ABC transporter permease [Clostridium sp. P21]|uniref:ABC transporter permease n=1 Tax=Clostridium muellerianum TaxID=2716538 RepID=A0A7Y0EFL1_9CLOT|nr:ABC transporter permease [Clostridium muellerianum]NMM62589.1 ABC transporter permease [Clostridium muellerianum]